MNHDRIEAPKRPVLLGLAALLLPVGAAAQETVEQRLQRVERENREILNRLDELSGQNEALTQELERFEFRDIIPPVGEGQHGLGPAASKVYERGQGLSIGGYGEFLFQGRTGAVDRFDALRSVLYVGYKFDDSFVFNSEIEIEHATTSAASGTTASTGSVSLEFGYLDYLSSDAFGVRAGLVLVPMGLINEVHEPTTYLPAIRPETEERIIPTTWRALGAGFFGEVSGFEYRTYVINSLDGERFDASGLRGGRQKGSRAAADDFAVVGRVDYVDVPGLLAGGSVYYGDTGQDGTDTSSNAIPDLTTTILEGHVEYRTGPWVFRGLYAESWVEDAGEFNTNTGENLAKRLNGWYVEGGFDVLAQWAPDSGQSLTPYVRYEQIDTQASMPAGFVADPTFDDTILTFGLNYKPIDQIVVKIDYQDADEAGDAFNILFGYVF